MTGAGLVRTLQDLTTLSRAQAWLRAGIVLGAAVPVLAAAAAGAGLPAWVAFAVGVATAISVLQPDSHAPLALIVLLGWHWFVTVDDQGSPWVLVAALGLLLLHACAAAAAGAPGGAPILATARGRWLRRSGIVAAATAGVWLATTVFSRAHAPGEALLTVSALVLLVALAGALRALSTSRR